MSSPSRQEKSSDEEVLIVPTTPATVINLTEGSDLVESSIEDYTNQWVKI